MPHYLLDSGPLGGYLLGTRRAHTLISPWIANKDVVTSNLAYAEVHEFILAFPDYHNRNSQLLRIVFGPIPALNLDYATLQRYGELRNYLRPRNLLIGDIDTLIAATALEANLTVVTNNARHFGRIPGLNVIVY